MMEFTPVQLSRASKFDPLQGLFKNVQLLWTS